MRILQVTPYYEDAWAYGGIPRAVAATARALAARGHAVTVCTTDAYLPHARLPRQETSDRNGQVDVRVFPNLSNAAAYHLQFFMPLGLDRYLTRHAGAFDLAHLHGCHHIPGALAARHLRRAGVPYVLTTHGTAPYIERRKLAKRVFDATIGRGMLAGAARVIAVSNAEKNQLLQCGVAGRSIDIVPNPLNIAEFLHTFPGAFRRRIGLEDSVPVVLFLGKLTPRKRLDVLVEAFASLGRSDVHLVIAGNDMGYGRRLRGLIERFGIGSRTHVPGLLSGPERLCALADADVVAYPSEDEVFGLVAVEALLCGTPVVVADDSGCGEVISRTGGGTLVPPGDVPALARALQEMLADPVRWRQAARDARVHVRQYSSEHVCTAIEEVYARTTARRDGEQAAAV